MQNQQYQLQGSQPPSLPYQLGNAGRQQGQIAMGNFFNFQDQNPNVRMANIIKINEQKQMQVENDASDPFKPIQEEKIDDNLKQRVIKLMIDQKDEVIRLKPIVQQTLKNLQKQQQQKQWEKNIYSDFCQQLALIEQLTSKKSKDFHTDLQEYLNSLRNNYILNQKNLIEQLQMFDKVTQNIQQQDITKFLQNREDMRQMIEKVKFLEELSTETKILQQLAVAINPQENLQQFIVYQSLQQKGKNITFDYVDKLEKYQEFSYQNFQQFIGLLNQYYDYQCLGEDQVNQQRALYSEDINILTQYGQIPVLYLFYYNKQNQQCIILIRQSDKNLRTFCVAKLRPFLQELLKDLDYKQQQHKIEGSLDFQEGVSKFFDLVGIKKNFEHIQKFLLEFHIYNKDNQLDIFEFEKLFEEYPSKQK